MCVGEGGVFLRKEEGGCTQIIVRGNYKISQVGCLT